MQYASFKQNIQDWITQEWVILFGKKITSSQEQWLLGPFGETNGIGEKFIKQLIIKEGLEIDHKKDKGLLESIYQLNLSNKEYELLSKNVIDFYENTSNYNLGLTVKWNPIFKIFGVLLKTLFSNRIEQLNQPNTNIENTESLKSDIIHLTDNKEKKLKRTIWLRTFKNSGKVVYSGVYETCTIPNGETCIKAIFPLPNGNATVILNPSVGKNGELILKSAGKKIGDSGFYFLLKDAKGTLWTKYIKSFKDQLIVSSVDDNITAIQTLTFWGMRVLTFDYNITKYKENS